MVEILKKRTVTVREMTESKGETRLRDLLAAIPGVKEVELLGTRELCIQYDLTKLRFRQIEESIRALGFELPKGFLSRWKRSWIDFTEENEYNNMMAKPPPCCSNPKGITSASHKK